MNIKDYLPLYLGAKHRYRLVDSDWSVWIGLLPYRLALLEDASIAEIQLALHPLSDITIENKKDSPKAILDKWGAPTIESMARLINYLRGLHIDCDGLIDAGLAVDVKTISK
jgi:hypothetical protein